MPTDASSPRENGIVKANRAAHCAGLLFFCALSCCAFARFGTATQEAFDRYIALSEADLDKNLHAGSFFPDRQSQYKGQLRSGEIAIESRTTLDNGHAIKVPDGRIHDWLGTMFIPGATLAQVRAVLQDYDNYKNIYQPDVIDSKLKGHVGGEFDIFLRLYKKQIITVVFNTDYHVRYGMIDPRHMYIISHSTRIAEVEDPKRSYSEELPPGNDAGFLWRLNAYWRFEESDGGVYAECRAISLSRDIPFGLGWMIGSFVEKFPRESMVNTLRATRKEVEARD